jgi:hypothetical protein
MARLSVHPIEIADSQIMAQARPVLGEVLCPVEHLHRRFDAAYDNAEELSALIQAHLSRGLDCTKLLRKLKEAEAERAAALAALRKARWLKVVPTA